MLYEHMGPSCWLAILTDPHTLARPISSSNVKVGKGGRRNVLTTSRYSVEGVLACEHQCRSHSRYIKCEAQLPP